MELFLEWFRITKNRASTSTLRPESKFLAFGGNYDKGFQDYDNDIENLAGITDCEEQLLNTNRDNLLTDSIYQVTIVDKAVNKLQSTSWINFIHNLNPYYS